MTRPRRPKLLIALVLVLAAVTTAALVVPIRGEKTITAYFPEAPSIYPGDPVRVLGVDVGKIDSITAEPGRAKVVLSYRADVEVPADATVAIVAPTLVTTRFIQLSPAHVDGAVLPDDATVPESRTATPVEWDATVDELTELADALGPRSGDVTGPLGRVLRTTRENIGGQGDQVRDTIRNASTAMTTLAAGGEDLFGTVRNLQSVVSNLERNDDAVQAFSGQLTQASDLLASNRGQLVEAVRTLDQVAVLLEEFVREHKDPLRADLEGVAGVARQLASNRQALGDFLQRAPTAVSNFNNSYDPTGSLMAGAFAINNLSDPATFTCSPRAQRRGEGR
ncbi:MCE family protein [Saccharopolyspora sp. HNM0983]|uniref:MCE family protein n=1 Tax=Saccharopolyspora montiporae TaxID=2781240 RepID=A0A929B6V3_9PSEU|nr:MCE family protein [Saccharopolyspora sp. HNM0983]MBE9373320.1 MCE family protein [Saccharopolyspora sp. HNM0983]